MTMKGPSPSGKLDSTGPDTDHTLQTAGAFSVHSSRGETIIVYQLLPICDVHAIVM